MGKKIKQKCPICDKIYLADSVRLKWGREKTCSRKCSYLLRAQKLTKSIQLTCPVCNKGFARTPSQLEHIKYVSVCSLECLYKGRSLGIIKREVKTPYKSSGPTTEIRNCQECGEEFSCPPSSPQKYCSRNCFESVHSRHMAGKGNPSYVDGSGMNRSTFRGSNWGIIRQRIYKRDNYTCQICDTKCISKNDAAEGTTNKIIQCHHIKPYETPEDNTPSNLITLCLGCHLKLHNGSPS